MSAAERAVVLPSLPPKHVDAQTSLTPPPFMLSLSTDHLLHLVQHNFFRALISNKLTLNPLLTGWTNNSLSQTPCPISGPWYDRRAIFPAEPSMPSPLFPAQLQQARLHPVWINLSPFARVRDNLIRSEGTFDHWELLQDFIGEVMAVVPTRERQDPLVSITVSGPKAKAALPLTAGCDEDKITAGRKGLIVWGEPHVMQNWEVTPGLLAKWRWVMEGCHDLVESSNHWKLMRGEDPMRL